MHQSLNSQGFNPTFDKVSEAIQSEEATSGFVVPVVVFDHNASISDVAYTPPRQDYQQPVSSHNPIFQAPQPAGGSPSNPNIPYHVIRRASNLRGQ
ncbi:hypothetical protein O181_076683 [Austropuccinia psidii MF-1]|uniref:Uncharacterized protein n=1 Tax=Austropuccinia psidii MF-1 TaxID=1389203 RepID=A0A9Q3FFH8_9BASI|nr:hypothetical protein [Austropuccinia psidii MF-1]